MTTAFGIHLGNSAVCLALYSNKTAKVIANDSGDRVTPAYLAFNDSEWEIGLPAKLGQARNKSVITNNKRLLDIDCDNIDINAVEIISTCKVVVNDDDKSVKYEFNSGGNKVFSTPDDIATRLYRKMFTIASNAVRTEEDLKLVLAAPITWTTESRLRLVKSAELAGFDVMQVISEPAAAVLAYLNDFDSEEVNILVYRLGSTSCDATILNVCSGLISIKNNVHVRDLGGVSLTNELVNYIAQEFYNKWKSDPRECKRSMKKIFHHADNCKHILSTLSSAQVFIESLLDGVDWSQNISRARFENIISGKINSFLDPIHSVLKGFTEKIDKVILCGGSMKIPKLQTAILSLLPDAEVLSGISPDEVIAEGCARQAGYIMDTPDLNLTEKHVEIQCLESNIHLKYLDKSVCFFKKGSCMNSQNEHYIDDINIQDKLEITFSDDDNKTIEKLSLDSIKVPFTIKGTLDVEKLSISVY